MSGIVGFFIVFGVVFFVLRALKSDFRAMPPEQQESLTQSWNKTLNVWIILLLIVFVFMLVAFILTVFCSSP